MDKKCFKSIRRSFNQMYPFGNPIGKMRYSDGCAKFANGHVVNDVDVVKYVRRHTHWWDRLDYHKMCDSAAYAFDILCGAIEEPKGRNGKWFF